MKEMATNAKFTGQTLTNFSARKQFFQKIRNENVSPTDIIQLSRHKNVQSVLNYRFIIESSMVD